MKEFKCEYKTPIRYIKKCPNKYTTIIKKFKEMKRLANLKIYSRIEAGIGTFPYVQLWKLIKITNKGHNNRYSKCLCCQTRGRYIIPFRIMRNTTRRLRKSISRYKNRRIE